MCSTGSSPILFNIFVNDPGDRADHAHSKFAYDTKLGGRADVPKDCVQFWAPWYKRKLELLKRVISVKDHKNGEEIGVPLL